MVLSTASYQMLLIFITLPSATKWILEDGKPSWVSLMDIPLKLLVCVGNCKGVEWKD